MRQFANGQITAVVMQPNYKSEDAKQKVRKYLISHPILKPFEWQIKYSFDYTLSICVAHKTLLGQRQALAYLRRYPLFNSIIKEGD